MKSRPERLNLALGKFCFVDCPGCYMYFGQTQPNLDAMRKTVAEFVRLGINKVTLSGGDPLTVPGINDFIVDIRELGVNIIKLDTVGTSLIGSKLSHDHPETSSPSLRLRMLAEIVDYIAIPLDGWSNESSNIFRENRPYLFDETVKLLDEFDFLNRTPNIVINTVIHAGNHKDAAEILDPIARHRSVSHWNIFQYSPTDQASEYINGKYQISNAQYLSACSAIQSKYENMNWAGQKPSIEFRSVDSRLGDYLLVNSDGDAWLPDRDGRTIHLGNIHGNENEILERWISISDILRMAK